MAKLSQIKQTRLFQNIMVYGPPKSGKTALVGELANEGFKLIWFDLEKGSATLLLVIEPDKQDNVELIQVNDTSEEPNAIRTVSSFLAAKSAISFCDAHGVVACAKCKTDPAATKTTIDPATLSDLHTVVVFDSLSQLSDSAMNHALGSAGAMITKKAEWDHYNAQGMLLKYVLSKAQASNYHTIFISHEESIEQEDGSEKITPVGGTRNFSKKLGRYFDAVVYCNIANKQHQANSSSTFSAKIQAGARTGIALEKGHKLSDLLLPSEELLEKSRQEILEMQEKSREKAKTSLKDRLAATRK